MWIDIWICMSRRRWIGERKKKFLGNFLDNWYILFTSIGIEFRSLGPKQSMYIYTYI